MRSTRSVLSMTVALSNESAHSSGMPSSRVSRTSDGMLRTVRVAGTTSTVRSTGMTSGRDITRNGRRPTFGASAHHTSPRCTAFTMVQPRSIGDPRRARSATSASVCGWRSYPARIASAITRSARHFRELVDIVGDSVLDRVVDTSAHQSVDDFVRHRAHGVHRRREHRNRLAVVGDREGLTARRHAGGRRSRSAAARVPRSRPRCYTVARSCSAASGVDAGARRRRGRR